VLLRAYASGIFPMAERRDDPGVYWIAPPVRGVLPLESFHIPRRLARTVRRKTFNIRCDTAFETVIEACAAAADDRPETWINDEIMRVFQQLHGLGHAHCVEVWSDGALVGGLYGLVIGGAFFGESMFSRATDASKVALVHLIARLRIGGFALLDAQFVTEHLRQFGAVEIPGGEYLDRLSEALQVPAVFYSDVSDGELESELSALLAQSRTQTS